MKLTDLALSFSFLMVFMVDKIEVCNCICCKADSFIPAIGTSVRNVTTLLSFRCWNQMPRLQPLLCNTFSFNFFTFLAFLSSLTRSSNNWMAHFHLLNSYWLMHVKIQQKKIKDEKCNDLCFCFCFSFSPQLTKQGGFLASASCLSPETKCPSGVISHSLPCLPKELHVFHYKWNWFFFSNTLNS